MAQGGDEGFRMWVSARREPLRRSAYLMSGDWYLADDLVQDAVARLYAVWDRVSLRGDPDAYVRRVVVNLLIDHRRRPWRREVANGDVPDRAATGVASDDRQGDVSSALTKLPPRQRATLVLRFWEDLSVEDTASILNCSTGTVKSNTSKALDNLRAALDDVGLGQPATATKDRP